MGSQDFSTPGFKYLIYVNVKIDIGIKLKYNEINDDIITSIIIY